MAHTYEELKGKSLEELREIAKGLPPESVQGFSQMNKDHLLPVLCKAFGIDTFVHHHTVGIDKLAVKAKMNALKKQRAQAVEAHDHLLLHSIRRQIHHFNRQIRSHIQ